MATEYIYDVIRAAANTPVSILADITDDSGEPITEGCIFRIFDNGKIIFEVAGVYNTENKDWSFNIPAAATYDGVYLYQILHGAEPLNFRTPIYFQ